MEYIFEYNGDKLININTIIRKQIADTYNNFRLIYNEEVSKEMMRSIIIDLYDDNYQSYYLYMLVLLADAYKMLTHNLKYNILTQSEKMFLDIFDINDTQFSDIIGYIERSEIVFNQMLDCLLEFDSLNLLGKKTVVQDSIILEEEIKKISPLYSLDIFEYGETSANDFLTYYEDSLNEIVINPYQLIESISFHMNHLYLYDRNQYLAILRVMCEVFYKWRKYNLVHNIDDEGDIDEIQSYLNIIEDNKLEEIAEITLFNKEFLLRVIDDFCYYEIVKKSGINYISENDEEINDFIKDYLPNSLKVNNQQKSKK